MAYFYQFLLNLSIAVISVMVFGLTMGTYVAKYHELGYIEKVMCWLVMIICGLNIAIYFTLLITEYGAR